MNDGPVAKPGILKIAPYVPGKSSVKSFVKKGEQVIKLSSNESPLGASPKAVEALKGLGDNLASYPDGSANGLRKALGEVHGLEMSQIVIGAGSDEILGLLAQAYLGEGDEAVISQYGFLMYPIVTLGAGATPVYAMDEDYRVDVDAMLAAVSPRTKIMFLANPNNPTGTYIAAEELARLHAGLRKDILLVVDSAYGEYVTEKDYEAGERLVRGAQNVVMVRTFSKIGLAALRIGWMYGPKKIVDIINRIRGPFNVNMGAQMAGEAAVRDVEFNARLKAHNAQWRDWLTSQLNGNSMRVLPSQGNFVLVLFNEECGINAAQANQALLEQGVVVREMQAYGLTNALRISIGDEGAMRKVAKVLQSLEKPVSV